MNVTSWFITIKIIDRHSSELLYRKNIRWTTGDVNCIVIPNNSLYFLCQISPLKVLFQTSKTKKQY